jgi:hypothetical protein
MAVIGKRNDRILEYPDNTPKIDPAFANDL